MNQPCHVALIMDGNGRWAQKRHLPRLLGHRAGVAALERLVRALEHRGVKTLSVYAFSTENWHRPKAEVTGLMKLFTFYAKRKVKILASEGIKLRFAGRRDNLPDGLAELMTWCEELTSAGDRFELVVCFNYGGQDELIRAFARAHAAGAQIDTPQDLRRWLDLPDLPDPDLIIRTGGEQRLSNFWTWQSAYSELWFTSVLWPDFTIEHFDRALEDFAERERRYGALKK